MPNIIYYCWFGEKPLSDEIKKMIQTWEQYFPTFTIIEINEKNFDISQYLYAQQAYEQKKYAFVSDCARIHFLNKTGGIYFDTDVEVIKNFEELFNDSTDILLSMEYFNFELTGVNTAVIVSKKEQSLWEEMLENYKKSPFDNTNEPETINKKITKLLEKNTKFTYNDYIAQKLFYDNDIIKIVSSKLLMRKSNDAYAIHHLDGSWKTNISFSRKIRRIFGIILKKIVGREKFEQLWQKNNH